MSLIFQDLQQLNNPMNGMRINNESEMASLFQSLKTRKPFIFELHSSNRFMMTIGLAPDCGSVQFSSEDGLPPYWTAISENAVDDEAFVEFLAGNTPTPISQRYCLPIEQVKVAVADFLFRGDKSEAVHWEEI
jgi:hypothetical protein